MKITVVGAGYVGLVSSACLTDLGHEVHCIETDAAKLDILHAGRVPIYEPGLARMIAAARDAGTLVFHGTLADAVPGSDVIFIAVGTPALDNGAGADLACVFQAARDIAALLEADMVVVTKSTVPVGTNRRVQETIGRLRPDVPFHMASNPEFLREGAAIQDFMNPDRIVIGSDSRFAHEQVRRVYNPLNLRMHTTRTAIFETELETAEIIKYGANAFLAMKIAFVNEMALLCEAVGADIRKVATGVGLDHRVGEHFLNAGPGYGGSCFPKDTEAMARFGRDAGVPQTLVEAVIASNHRHKLEMVGKIARAADNDLAGKTVAVLGVTFKANTDDVREASSLLIVPELLSAGADVRLVDPKGRAHGEALLPGASWAEDAYRAAVGAHVVVVNTEWAQFFELDLDRIAQAMETPVLVDLRNIFDAERARQAGLSYHPLGARPSL